MLMSTTRRGQKLLRFSVVAVVVIVIVVVVVVPVVVSLPSVHFFPSIKQQPPEERWQILLDYNQNVEKQ